MSGPQAAVERGPPLVTTGGIEVSGGPGSTPAGRGKNAAMSAPTMSSTNDERWSLMRILGIDYGTRRFGFAISDEVGIIATPLCVVEVTGEKDALAAVERLCAEQDAGKIVIGLPINMDGTIGPAAKAVNAFVELLQKETGLPVDTWDERLTTSMVERTLIDADVSRAKRKGVRDKLAAQVILQSYLDREEAC